MYVHWHSMRIQDCIDNWNCRDCWYTYARIRKFLKHTRQYLNAVEIKILSAAV